MIVKCHPTQPEPREDAVSRAEIIRLILERGLYCDTQADRETSAEIIRQLPSVQPEIIHCRDCRFAMKTYDGHIKYCTYLRDNLDVTDSIYYGGDDFCSHAERKEDK